MMLSNLKASLSIIKSLPHFHITPQSWESSVDPKKTWKVLPVIVFSPLLNDKPTKGAISTVVNTLYPSNIRVAQLNPKILRILVDIVNSAVKSEIQKLRLGWIQ